MNIEMLSKRAVGSSQLFLKRHGPALLTTAGIMGFAATTYLTGKAVLKSQDKVKALKLKNDEIVAEEETSAFTRNDKARKLGEVWIRDGGLIVRDFTPAIAAGSVSIFCFIAAHGMMKNQYKALGAAYLALDSGFRSYRARVREELGEEKELALYRSVKMLPREEGTDPALPCEIDYDDKMPSAYARFFDDSSTSFSKTPEYNLYFLKTQQQYANDRLNAYGFVFLNEVYEWLGLERTQAGQVVGWVKNGNGDNYISFGIHDIFDESSRAFVNGHEPVVLLDFNVDGPILIP